MDDLTGSNSSIKTSFPSAPTSSSSLSSNFATQIGDGFTAEELQRSLQPEPLEPWHPPVEYTETEIPHIHPGPGAVTFMSRVANIYDAYAAPKTPRSAKGCLKLCVKDDGGAITVRLWYANRAPAIRPGSLVSVWSSHVSSDDSGKLSSRGTPLFVSLFPERDRKCHLMVHENSEYGQMFKTPSGFRKSIAVDGLMTLQNFISGGYETLNAKILVVVKTIGSKKQITRKDQSTTENVNIQVHDDTAIATLGLWGTAASSPFERNTNGQLSNVNPEAIIANQGWKAGETILLLRSPGCKFGVTTYLSLTSSSVVDINPDIPDMEWLRRWSLRQQYREALNPAFPEGIFDLEIIQSGPIRCLFSIAELDEFARIAPNENFQGYLSLMIVEIKLLECWKRGMLLCNDCCGIPAYANATTALCKECGSTMHLRLNPMILGQVVDETAVIAPGKLLLSDRAWADLLGRTPEDMLKLKYDDVKAISDRLLFCRIIVMFGWSGDESKAGGRICVLGVLN